MKKLLAVVAAMGTLAGVAHAQTKTSAKTSSQWKACNKEIKRYCSTAKTSQEIFDCIEQREKMGKKSGISKACYKAHEKMETPAQESKEKHEQGEERGEGNEQQEHGGTAQPGGGGAQQGEGGGH